MSAVTTRQQGGTLAAHTAPELPEPIARHLAALDQWHETRAKHATLQPIDQAKTWDGGTRPTLPALDAQGREACANAADDYAAMLGRHVSPAQIRAWLMPVNAGVRNPQDGDGFNLRASAIALACQELPAAAFDAATQRDLMSKSSFFPAVPDVLAIVQPVAARWRREMEALEAASRPPAQAAGNPPQAPQAAMPQADRAAHAAAMVKSLKAALLPVEDRIPASAPDAAPGADLVAELARLRAMRSAEELRRMDAARKGARA